LVLGRVRHLKAESASAPLIFFRGGYGRFHAGTLIAGDASGDLQTYLHIVDRARPEMAALANATGEECVASAIVGGDLVLLASATPGGGATPRTLVGQRISGHFPAGAFFMAWETPDRLLAWLEPVQDQRLRAAVLKRLSRIRARRYAVSPEGLALGDWDHLLRADAGVSTLTTRLTQITQTLDHGSADGVRTVHSPVFDATGRAVIALSLGDFDALTQAEFERFVALMLAATDRITDLIGGRRPSVDEADLASAEPSVRATLPAD
jgi:DNA-binding IclR family transcriptional regulator